MVRHILRAYWGTQLSKTFGVIEYTTSISQTQKQHLSLLWHTQHFRQMFWDWWVQKLTCCLVETIWHRFEVHRGRWNTPFGSHEPVGQVPTMWQVKTLGRQQGAAFTISYRASFPLWDTNSWCHLTIHKESGNLTYSVPSHIWKTLYDLRHKISQIILSTRTTKRWQQRHSRILTHKGERE